jgi:hypothetical protein
MFIHNVDPIIKVLHIPSLQRFLQSTAFDLDQNSCSKQMAALMFAIYFAAVISMTDEECLEHAKETKQYLLPKYQKNIELALAQADFMSSPEIATLQALVIYLVSHSIL